MFGRASRDSPGRIERADGRCWLTFAPGFEISRHGVWVQRRRLERGHRIVRVSYDLISLRRQALDESTAS
jgi:hypothetical protein